MLYRWLKRTVLLLFAPHICQSSCSIIAKLPLPLYAHQLGYGKDPNIIYLFGGRTTNGQYINPIYKWNISTPTTFLTLSVTTPSTFMSWSNNAVSLNDKIYFVGVDDGTWASDVYIFDVITETWIDNTNIAKPSHRVIYGCLTANATHLFYIGGENDGTWLDRIQIYDLISNAWFDEEIDIPPIKDNGWSLGYCQFVNEYLYIFGGAIQTDSIYINHIFKWNPTEKWSIIGYLPYAHSDGRAVHNDDSIYLIGGYNDVDTVSSIYEFDVNTDTIINIYNMTQSLSDLSATIISNKLYIFGGWNSEIIEAIDDVQICDIIENLPSTTDLSIESTTINPTTSAPTTYNPTTSAPTTYNPTTVNPTTSAPTTYIPTTVNPTTSAPTTMLPTTYNPTTSFPTTINPTTVAPTINTEAKSTVMKDRYTKTTNVTLTHKYNKEINNTSSLLIILIFINVIIAVIICIVLIIICIYFYRKRLKQYQNSTKTIETVSNANRVSLERVQSASVEYNVKNVVEGGLTVEGCGDEEIAHSKCIQCGAESKQNVEGVFVCLLCKSFKNENVDKVVDKMFDENMKTAKDTETGGCNDKENEDDSDSDSDSDGLWDQGNAETTDAAVDHGTDTHGEIYEYVSKM